MVIVIGGKGNDGGGRLGAKTSLILGGYNVALAAQSGYIERAKSERCNRERERVSLAPSIVAWRPAFFFL